MRMRPLALVFCLISGAAFAAWHSVLQVSVAGSAGLYSGPGDVVSGFQAWWGLRAYSAAVAATGTQKSVQLVRASDSATADVLIATSGDLGLTANASAGSNGVTPAAWAGTDATGTGSISGTTLTFTGGHAGSFVSGTGVTPGTYITAGSSPNWTVYPSQTVASTAITLTYGLNVAKFYDQTGNGYDLTQASLFSRPQFVPAGSNGLPYLSFYPTPVWLGGASAARNYASGTLNWVQQPIDAFNSGTIVGVIGSSTIGLSVQKFSDNNWYAGWDASGDQRVVLAASSGNWVTSSLSGYSVAWSAAGTTLFRNGSSIGTNGSAPNIGSSSGVFLLGSYNNSTPGATPFAGSMVEAGIANTLASGGNETALSSQQRAYWGY